MDKLPFDTTGLQPYTIETFLNTFNTLEERFPSKFDNLFDFELDKFEMVSYCDSAEPNYSIDVSKGDNIVHVSFALVNYPTMVGRGSRNIVIEYLAFVVAKLHKDYGHIIIKSQTLLDRVEGLFIKHPVVKFPDDKQFSRHYFTGSPDADKAVNLITEDFRNAVRELGDVDFMVELLGDTLLIGTKDATDEDRVVLFAELAHKIAALSKGRVSSPTSF